MTVRAELTEVTKVTHPRTSGRGPSRRRGDGQAQEEKKTTTTSNYLRHLRHRSSRYPRATTVTDHESASPSPFVTPSLLLVGRVEGRRRQHRVRVVRVQPEAPVEADLVRGLEDDTVHARHPRLEVGDLVVVEALGPQRSGHELRLRRAVRVRDEPLLEHVVEALLELDRDLRLQRLALVGDADVTALRAALGVGDLAGPQERGQLGAQPRRPGRVVRALRGRDLDEDHAGLVGLLPADLR